ncbi:hypothetical protein NO2A_01614 [Planktothrix agardhii]|nr:hypothetical protein NO2A_01614 [Planktothrix agardhii]
MGSEFSKGEFDFCIFVGSVNRASKTAEGGRVEGVAIDFADAVIRTILAREQDVGVPIIVKVGCGDGTIANTGEGDVRVFAKTATAVVAIDFADAVTRTIPAREQDVGVPIFVKVGCGDGTTGNTGEGDVGVFAKTATAVVAIDFADAVKRTIEAREQDIGVPIFVKVGGGDGTTGNTSEGDVRVFAKTATAVVAIDFADAVIRTIEAREQDIGVPIFVKVGCGDGTKGNTGEGDVGVFAKTATAVVAIDFADAARTIVAREQDVGVPIFVKVGCGDGTIVNTGEGDVGVFAKTATAVVAIDFADAARTRGAREQDVGVPIIVKVGCGDGTSVNTGEGDVGVFAKTATAVVAIDFADAARTRGAREQDVGVPIIVKVGCGDGTIANTGEGDVRVFGKVKTRSHFLNFL